MSHAWLSDAHAPLAREVARGLKARGWTLGSGADTQEPDVLLEFWASGDDGFTDIQIEEGTGSVILIVPVTTRLHISELSLRVQGFAIAQAPARRVNAIAVDDAQADKLAPTIDWLVGAEMVTGQLIVLSSDPALTLLL